MRCSSILIDIIPGSMPDTEWASAVFPSVVHQEDSGLMKCLFIALHALLVWGY